MSANSKFWQWFGANNEALFNVEGDSEKLFDQIQAALANVDPSLTFEMGPRDLKRDFIVSADGIKDSFPTVESLVAAAPEFTQWRVIAFRPRRTLPCVVELSGRKVNSENTEFSLLHDGMTVGVRLFMPGFKEEDTEWKQIGYLLLDEALGEYDVETRVGLIKMYPPDAATGEKRYPLCELPNAFDTLASRLEHEHRQIP